MAAGTINVAVGTGTLITFPVLLACGYSPVVANVSNSVGLVPGSLSGVVGYRAELAGQRSRMLRFGAASVLGALAGAAALLALPGEAFEAAVPIFIGVALVLILVQPRIAKRLAASRSDDGDDQSNEGPGIHAAIAATGVYGGYFGAAQGIMLLACMGIALPDDLQRLNALKNFLVMLVNAVSGLVFVMVADVAWGAAGLIAGGAGLGGVAGARYGRRLSPRVLRGLIVAVGLVAMVRLLTD